MSTKENYCYRILKEYSLIVDFDVELPDLNYDTHVPRFVAEETYGQWRNRVLGPHVSNVVLYTPNASEPKNQTRISTLQKRAGADHLKKIFNAINMAGKIRKKAGVNTAIEETERKFTMFARETLEDIVENSNEDLEPSVKDFFDRFLNMVEPDVDGEKIICELLNHYNEAVRSYRVANAKAVDLERQLKLSDR
ncbi:MAG: hypothetical protein Q8P42_05045 [Gallionella sp.]|nr:hypothetical protein [Gallionella sp.]